MFLPIQYSKNLRERFALCHQSSNYNIYYIFVLQFHITTQQLGYC